MTTLSEYAGYNNIANKILREISVAYSIELPDIRWKNFVNLLKEKYGVLITAYKKFDGKLAHFFAGSLLVTSEGAVIGYNATSFQAVGRQRFTVVHEGVHFMCDAQKGQISQSFSDLLKSKNYSDLELQEEDNANFVSSIIMCNDSALVASMKNGDNISDFCNKFGFTRAAAWTRIYNYLYFSFNIPSSRASTLVNAYVFGSDTERKTFLNILIPNKNSFFQYMNRQTFFYAGFDTLKSKWHDSSTTQSHFYQFKYLVDDLYKYNGKSCVHCHHNFYGNKKYCCYCGTHLEKQRLMSTERELMDTGIVLNEKHICTTCPHCGIENNSESKICQYCGAFLQNICTGITPKIYKTYVLQTPSSYDISMDWIVQFGHLEDYKGIIPGNFIVDNVLLENELGTYGDYPHKDLHFLNGFSRFCDQCGCVSSFYLQKLLCNVNIKTSNNPFD